MVNVFAPRSHILSEGGKKTNVSLEAGSEPPGLSEHQRRGFILIAADLEDQVNSQRDHSYWHFLPGARIDTVRDMRLVTLQGLVFILVSSAALITQELAWIGLAALVGLGILVNYLLFIRRPAVATGMVKRYDVPLVNLTAAVDKVLDDEGVGDRIYTKVLDFNDTRGNTAFMVGDETAIFLMQYEPWTMVHIGPMRLSKRELIERLTRLVDRAAMIAKIVESDTAQQEPID